MVRWLAACRLDRSESDASEAEKLEAVCEPTAARNVLSIHGSLLLTPSATHDILQPSQATQAVCACKLPFRKGEKFMQRSKLRERVESLFAERVKGRVPLQTTGYRGMHDQEG